MSDAISATGILLQRGGGGSPESYTSLAEITSLQPPGFMRNEIEVTNHNEGVEAKILGILRHGQCEGTCNWLPTNATQKDASGGMLNDIKSNVAANWQITFPPAGLPKFRFGARVQKFSPSPADIDTALQMDFALTLYTGVTVVEV